MKEFRFVTGSEWVDQIVDMIKAYHEEADSLFATLSFDTKKTRDEVTRAVRVGSHTFMAGCFEGDVLLGVYWGSVVQPLYSDERYGSDIGLFVRPEARCAGVGEGLVELAEFYYREFGCKFISNGTNSGVRLSRGANKMYKNLGYSEVGRTFQRKL